MIIETDEMKRYEKACTMFEAAGITYEELDVNGFSVTFWLSKGEMGFKTSIDFSFEHWERNVEMTCSCMDNFIDWKAQEEKRQERKRKRAERKKG